jgi:hypothetical protein
MSTAYWTSPPASRTVSFEKVPGTGHKSYPTRTRTIRLFDSKYVGIFNTHMECVAFVKGVEVVLDYMLKMKDVKFEAHLGHPRGCRFRSLCR